mgnify:CR=1 FL=1
MELSLIGLQNAGKTSLVNVVAVSIILSLPDRPNVFFTVLISADFFVYDDRPVDTAKT